MAFLYLPIAILVIYSFNDSRLVTVWGGWSVRWYGELLADAPLIDAALISFRLALISATAATILGTLAALALVRFGRFRGRVMFSAMIYAPLVMPEVITGLSLLLLFVAVAADRGFWTVAIAHTTMAMCFVTIIVQSRLVDFDTGLEEAPEPNLVHLAPDFDYVVHTIVNDNFRLFDTLTYRDLLDRLIELALAQHREKQRTKYTIELPASTSPGALEG